MADIILYTNPQSRGRIVHWMLEELEVPYQIKMVNFGPRMKSRTYTAINPMGKVPALKHGDALVTETPAILAYLADTFADKGLIPPTGSPLRAAFYRWLFFTAGPLEQACAATSMGWETEGTTHWGTPASGYLGFGSLALTLTALENHLTQNTYVCGEQFTAADIYLASHLNFNILVTKSVDPRSIFVDYIRSLDQRPAKLRADTSSEA